jgi:hypothetical protein
MSGARSSGIYGRPSTFASRRESDMYASAILEISEHEFDDEDLDDADELDSDELDGDLDEKSLEPEGNEDF